MKLTQLEMGKCLQTILRPKRIVKRRKRKKTAEEKFNLLLKCTEAITANVKAKANESSNPKISAFALYVDEKL